MSFRGLVLVLLACCGVRGPSVHAVEPPAGKIDPSKLQIGFADGTITLNGTKLSLPVERKELVRVLGEPSRELPLANNLLTWDELGIHAYQVPDSTSVRAISVALAPKDFKFWPKKVFSGTVKVEGAVITAQSNVDEVNRTMKRHAFRKSDLGDSRKLEYDTCVLYLIGVGPGAKDAKAKFAAVEFDVQQEK